MKTFRLSDISTDDIRSIAHFFIKAQLSDWDVAMQVSLTDDEREQIARITNRLLQIRTSVINEATIWARAIYPLLMLAENDYVRAWSQVPIKAHYPHVELQGIADGILGIHIAGDIGLPYLVVVEAKRGLESADPRPQLYGQMLATAYLNWEHNQQPVQELFGCYTISDTWTFARAEVKDIDTDAPTMTVEFSREYSQRIEGETIVKILKHIVALHADTIYEVMKG